AGQKMRVLGSGDAPGRLSADPQGVRPPGAPPAVLPRALAQAHQPAGPPPAWPGPDPDRSRMRLHCRSSRSFADHETMVLCTGYQCNMDSFSTWYVVLMLEVTRLRALGEVVPRGSFSAAADSLPLPKSAVSQQIAVLEREVGIPLLERTTAGPKLTSAGEALMEHGDAVI